MRFRTEINSCMLPASANGINAREKRHHFARPKYQSIRSSRDSSHGSPNDTSTGNQRLRHAPSHKPSSGLPRCPQFLLLESALPGPPCPPKSSETAQYFIQEQKHLRMEHPLRTTVPQDPLLSKTQKKKTLTKHGLCFPSRGFRAARRRAGGRRTTPTATPSTRAALLRRRVNNSKM